MIFCIRKNVQSTFNAKDANEIADQIEANNEIETNFKLSGSSLPELADPGSPLLDSMNFKFKGDIDLKKKEFRMHCKRLIIFGDMKSYLMIIVFIFILHIFIIQLITNLHKLVYYN